MSRPRRPLAAMALASALAVSGVVTLNVGPATSTTKPHPHDHHDIGTMVDPYATGGPGFDGARLTTRTAARTVTVDPAKGPDFEMPFRCGEAWVGSTRSSHSPSRYSIDFNRTGDTGRPVLSSAPGVVYRVAKASGYGNYVIVDHGAGYSTLYAHLQATHVSVGQVVDQSAVVGFVGSTGRVTGPHLHFEQRLNGNYFAPYFHRTRFVFDRTVSSQSCADTPLVGDWDGDGTDNVAVFRRTTGLGTTFQNTPAGSRVIRYGAPGYTPFTGDWDGNGITQLGSRAARSTAFQLRGEDGRTSQANMGGSIKDTPISGTWVRSAKSSIGVYSHVTRKFTLRYPDLSKKVIAFGAAGTQPIVGDWDGNGVTDVGSFNVSTGQWQLRAANGTVRKLTYGRAGDVAVPGDWNGDGVTDLGLWRPSTAYFFQRPVANPNTVKARASYASLRYGARRG